jgi:hypothetical protein
MSLSKITVMTAKIESVVYIDLLSFDYAIDAQSANAKFDAKGKREVDHVVPQSGSCKVFCIYTRSPLGYKACVQFGWTRGRELFSFS